ncbi:hypothetical protein FEV53_15605 [Palleronia caenipelagi]|uniref:Uncharacterized protein n=1 Tax=Palleronia caenipelagi TaxID=2489174 RepID=A0A547PNC1_9RHOB|nr:hypothetical protein FEV53_15605 [Palleronia caenipelagi]
MITANTERTPLSVGTALIAPADYPDNIYQLDHRLLAARFNTWSDTTHYSFLRTVHRDNKSQPRRTGEQQDLTQREIAQILKDGFGRKPAFFKHDAWAFEAETSALRARTATCC